MESKPFIAKKVQTCVSKPATGRRGKDLDEIVPDEANEDDLDRYEQKYRTIKCTA